MNRKQLYLLLSLRRLPKEYNDAERAAWGLGGIGLLISTIVFLPDNHIVAFLAVSVGMYFLGRAIGLILHDREAGSSAIRAIWTTRTVALAIVVTVILIAVLDWAWTSRQPVFVAESIFLSASLTWFLRRGSTRFILGLIDMALTILAVVFFLFLHWPGFLAAAGYAAFIAWALLFRKQERKSNSPFQFRSDAD